ncbi:MAG: hypothetical protein GWP91_25920, partial [Rhodobacterales bacterium]|nr:hypothetical protein [Rhodobacterales bacterium]
MNRIAPLFLFLPLFACGGSADSVGLDGADGRIGVTGPAGVPGEPGPAAEGGLSCWDLDASGMCEVAEDVDGDGACDAL